MRPYLFQMTLWATLAAGVSLPMNAQALSPSEHAGAPHWTYDGDHGPGHWSSMDHAFVSCGNGKQQSPINLVSAEARANGVDGFHINYVESNATLINNGHTIQANVEKTADTVTIGGATYTLAQFHFHTPSEHTVDGKHYPIEIHFVNKDADGHLTVVGVLVRPGEENEALASLFHTLPREPGAAGTPEQAPTPVNLTGMLPKDHKAYLYEGSLTTPPCSEGVHWIVLAEPIEMSQEQIEAFSKIFHDNHRPLQKINGREVDVEKD